MTRTQSLLRAHTWVLAVALLASLQFAGQAAEPAGTKEPSLTEPVAHRVYQRDLEGRGEIPVVLNPALKGATVDSVTLFPLAAGTYRFVDGKLSGVPTGGPYFINVTVKVDKSEQHVQVGPVFVGDLWVLAGQSNMQGYGDLVDVAQPDPKVMALDNEGTWVEAKEPLHSWLLNPQAQKVQPKGAGLGLPFAKLLVQETHIPIGLLPTAVGGTSMEQWDPAKKNQGRNSLYGTMLSQIKDAGGRVKGILWYQGEAESSEANAKTYGKVFPAFIAAVRDDLHQPDLPFYLVQLSRFAVLNEAAAKYWNAVQEVQRKIPEQIPHTAVVPAVDLEIDDGIHIGTQGQIRLGQRLARVALRELYGRPGASPLNLESVTKGPQNTLIVKFKGVNVESSSPGMPGFRRRFPTGAAVEGAGLQPARHIAGFSIRNEEGTEVLPIFDARVALSGDSVILKLTGDIPKKAQLWYGRGHNPYCNLTDSMDMAAPVFGPIPLDDVK
jgi:carbohydrate esterase-like sialic acid-specific acetylesterase